MRLLNDTRFVIPFLLLLISIFSVLLYLNVTSRLGGSDNPTIGVITYKTKNVLRKFNDQVVWDSIESNQEVKNRDTIRTEGLSDAVLTLNDGTKINIAENSMILLDISDKNINVNFAYGSFEAARENTNQGDVKMNITAGDKVVEVGKGDVKLDKTKNELNLKVGEGEAKITANGKEETISKDEVANVSSEGVKVTKPRFGLVSPSDRKNILTDSGSEVIQFSVSGVNADLIRSSSPILEISSSQDFSKSVAKEKLKSGTFQKTLVSGSYFWRVTYIDPENKAKQSTEIVRFRVITNPQLRLFLPKDGDNFSYTTESPVVKLAWGNLDLYTNYTAEIAKDNKFSVDLKSKQTQNQAISFDNLSDGVYYARVIARSNIPDINEKISPISQFTVGKKLNLEPPVLVEPAKNKSYTKDQIKNQIFFSWKDNKDYKSYDFEISSDANFSNIISKQNSENSFIKFGNELNEGNYFWRVKGNVPGKESLLSSIYSFSIISKEDLNLLSPVNNSEHEINENSGILLKWKKLNTKVNYKLEISKLPNFSNLIVSEQVTNTFYDFKAKDFGKFYWRVIADTEPEKTKSEEWIFVLSSSMEPPILISPTKNETIDLSNRNNIVFTWKAQEKAIAYKIKIFDISGIKEKQIVSERTTQLKFVISDFTKLNEGRHKIEICSLYSGSDVEKESAYYRSDFFINLPKLNIPKILTPGTIYVE
ncbi:MAG: FecR domain-containing protein [Leptospira sp.]|nr:FecR domain-containing protein [Leptospira sp.]